MVKKKKKKTRKKKYKPFDLQEGETPKDYLRRRARESGFSDINDRNQFPPKWVINYGIIFIVLLILISLFGESSYVDECQKGFFNIVPDHCRN
jgi:hypothetical protein